MIRFLQTPGPAKKIVLGALLLIVCVMMVITLVPGGLFGDYFGGGVTTAGVLAKIGSDDITLQEVAQRAGGGLSAGLALLARDSGGPALCFQFLGIPELDDRLETASMRAFIDTPMWSRPQAVLSWQRYLGTDDRSDVSIYAAPSRATDLSGLPPAYISAMEFDPLRDEGILYALRMLQAGVSVELHSFPGTWHGSTAITAAAVSRRQLDEMVVVLRRALRGAS